MTLLTQIVILLNALIHLGFAVGEIFFTTYLLETLFGFSTPDALKTTPIAKNAGIYNSFIAAGLFWSAFTSDNSLQLRLFFLICVAIAGIFGALTLPSKDQTKKRNINTLFLQTLPATIGVVLVITTHS
jgi:putative membrane protein